MGKAYIYNDYLYFGSLDDKKFQSNLKLQVDEVNLKRFLDHNLNPKEGLLLKKNILLLLID